TATAGIGAYRLDDPKPRRPAPIRFLSTSPPFRRPACSASPQPEAADARLPSPCRGCLVVLVHIPECAVVGWIHGQRGVVAPPGADGLRARAVDQDTLAQSQLTKGVTGQPTRVADAREDRRAVGNTEPQADVTAAVHRGAPHPTIDPVVGSVGALLVDGELTAGD